MEKNEFERKLDKIIPQPDTETTSALLAFYQELGEDPDCYCMQDLFNSLHFISRHFNAEVTQGVYEIIRYGAALPDELLAAAFHMANSCDCTPQQMAQAADGGKLMCFYAPKDAEELSPLAVCAVEENGSTLTYCTMHFGSFDPEVALQTARQYAQDRQSSVTAALRSLTVDMELEPIGGARKILMSGDEDMVRILAASFDRFPALAARLTFDVDRDQVSVEYNPLWLELRQSQEPGQSKMELKL